MKENFKKYTKWSIKTAVCFILIIVCFFIFNKQKIERVWVSYEKNQAPRVPTLIQGKLFELECNFISKYPLSLTSEILDQLQKKSHQTLVSTDIKGNNKQSKGYIISEIKIGKNIFKDVLVEECNTLPPSIGRPLFDQYNILYDFGKYNFIFCDNPKQLEKHGYRLQDMYPVPFKMTKMGIAISLQTEWGTFFVNAFTNATHHLIRSEILQNSAIKKDALEQYYVSTDSFIIGDHNYGKEMMYLFNLPPGIDEIGGSLSLDFLKNHAIYVDYHNQLLYISE